MYLCEYMHVCFENKGTDPPLLGEEGSYIPDRDAGVEAKFRAVVTA